METEDGLSLPLQIQMIEPNNVTTSNMDTSVLNTSKFKHLFYFSQHKKCRNKIETTFGILKRRFLCLHNENRLHVKSVPNVIIACCVLHNIAMDRGLIDLDEFDSFNPEDFGMEHNDEQDYEGPQDFAVRDHIVNQVFR